LRVGEKIKEFTIPSIIIYFSLVKNDNINYGYITQKLKLNPMKENKNEWVYEVIENNCDNINIPSNKMLDILYNKMEIINDLCKKYRLEVHFTFVISVKIGNSPLSKISKEFISFASSINAQMGFDLYCYEEDGRFPIKEFDFDEYIKKD